MIEFDFEKVIEILSIHHRQFETGDSVYLSSGSLDLMRQQDCINTYQNHMCILLDAFLDRGGYIVRAKTNPQFNFGIRKNTLAVIQNKLFVVSFYIVEIHSSLSMHLHVTCLIDNIKLSGKVYYA